MSLQSWWNNLSNTVHELVPGRTTVDNYVPSASLPQPYYPEGQNTVSNMVSGAAKFAKQALADNGITSVGSAVKSLVDSSAKVISDSVKEIAKPTTPVSSGAPAGFPVVPEAVDYLYADLAKHYGMDASTAYQEALANTSYQRMVSDLQAAGLNPVLATGRSGAASDISGQLAQQNISSVVSSGGKVSSAKNLDKVFGAVAGLTGLLLFKSPAKAASFSYAGAKLGQLFDNL